MVQQALTFNAIRKDWLGDGGEPVPLEQAQARADVCTGRLGCHGKDEKGKNKPCPCNYSGAWLHSIVKSIAINSQLDLRNAMNIKLEGEDALKTCEVCGCVLRLKVHIPFIHLYRHSTIEEMERFPHFCWLAQEYQALKTTKPQ